MKKLIPLFTFTLILHLSTSAAVPLRWTVETSRAVPAQFEAYQGETLALEAALQSYGKPLEAPANYSLYWQTNGMGNAWWSTNVSNVSSISNPSNLLRATWTPSMETGAKVYNCFIGKPGTIYHAAFQLRLRPSPGATPNELPLPQKVIDFAKVTVLNPPWSGGGGGGGVDTNAVRDIVRDTLATNGIRSVDGAARPLPKYLHLYNADDSYPEAAAEYYRSRGNGKTDGGCSSVRDGGFLYRNFDYPFDDRAEFVVKMRAGPNRFASVGVAQAGTNLTEQMVTSGNPEYSRLYKWLPGATVDGVNENGVACNINVVDGDPQTSGWHMTGDLHPLGAIRWILDHATNAQHGATYIASNIRFPSGWTQNFHYMIADETTTYIVEDGTAHKIISSPVAMTNFKIFEDGQLTGEGQERYNALIGGANITSQWWTLTYTAAGYRASDLPGITGEALTQLFNYWENNKRESHRGERFGNVTWWQTLHTSIYDITNRVLRVAVQEVDDWYVFQVPSSGAKVDAYTKAETDAKLAGKRDLDDLKVYEKVGVGDDWVWTSEDADLLAALRDNAIKPERIDSEDPEMHWWYIRAGLGSWSLVGGFDTSPATSPVVEFTFDNPDASKLGITATATRAHEFRPVSPTDFFAKVSQLNGKLDVERTSGVVGAPPFRFGWNQYGAIEYSGLGGCSCRMLPTGGLVFIGDTLSFRELLFLNGMFLGEYLDSLDWRTTGDRTLADYGIEDGATQEEVNEAKTAANDANAWSSATFNFMTGGRTNCWFSGTNYVFGTDAAARTRFAWEDGMEAATVPCSMALWEIRDGVRQLVWDQRDWTAWYWSFKANQMQTNVTAQISALGLAVTNDSNYAWAKRYASDGTPNPDASTTFIDTPSVTLSPGMKWETVATVSGAAYWTIVGDGAIIGGSGTNAVLRIQDFEGNDIMTVTKGEHRLAWIERGEITGQMHDGDGWVCFDMLADAEPIGYFSTTLDSSDFLPQTDPNCPAQYEWEDLHNGKYRIHYLLKPGIQSNACFAKFQVEVEGQTIIRYNAGQEISGGLIYNGVKIAPDISGSPAVGTVIQWKVVNR